MPGRTWSSKDYRYGFNGKEMDDDMSGGKKGVLYDYGFRIFDSRIAKFLSVDPLTSSYPWYTPYQFAGNMPIWAIDLDGLEEKVITREEFEKLRMPKLNLPKSEIDRLGNPTSNLPQSSRPNATISQASHSQEFLDLRKSTGEFALKMQNLNYQIQSLYPTLYSSPVSRVPTNQKGFGLMSGLAEGAKAAPFVALSGWNVAGTISNISRKSKQVANILSKTGKNTFQLSKKHIKSFYFNRIVPPLKNPVNWGAAVGDGVAQSAWILGDAEKNFSDFNITGTVTNLLGLRPFGQAVYANTMKLDFSEGFRFDLSKDALWGSLFGSLGNKFGEYILGNNKGFFNSMYTYTGTNSATNSQVPLFTKNKENE